MRTLRLTWPAAPDPAGSGEVFLSPDQARHGVLVLRLKAGAAVEMVGPGGLAPALVTTVETSGKAPRLGVTLSGPWLGAAAVGPRLALALISGQRFDWAVEKAVELGAATLIPLISERVKGGGARPGPAKEERWQRLAEEARKQCARPAALDIFPPLALAELLGQPGPGFFLSPSGPAAPPAAPSPLLAVGPEGGFSPAEEKAFLKAGFSPWSLGPGILRSETAALAALAVLRSAAAQG